MMEPTPEEILEIQRAKICQARQMSGEEKIRAGILMFDAGCAGVRTKIASTFPHFDDPTVNSIVRTCIDYYFDRRA